MAPVYVDWRMAERAMSSYDLFPDVAHTQASANEPLAFNAIRIPTSPGKGVPIIIAGRPGATIWRGLASTNGLSQLDWATA